MVWIEYNVSNCVIILMVFISNQTNQTEDDIKYPEMKYFINESLSDVVFVVDGQPLPALKQFLSVKSKVFRDMFLEISENQKNKR